MLPADSRSEAFLSAAEHRGIAPAEAVRLAVERHLVLEDVGIFGLETAVARHLLQRAAERPRPSQPLTDELAADLRRLTVGGRPGAAPAHLEVGLPDRLAVRARGRVRGCAFDPKAVGEMLSWEIAATIEGRTMSEWALKTLAAAVAPAQRSRASR